MDNTVPTNIVQISPLEKSYFRKMQYTHTYIHTVYIHTTYSIYMNLHISTEKHPLYECTVCGPIYYIHVYTTYMYIQCAQVPLVTPRKKTQPHNK